MGFTTFVCRSAFRAVRHKNKNYFYGPRLYSSSHAIDYNSDEKSSQESAITLDLGSIVKEFQSQLHSVRQDIESLKNKNDSSPPPTYKVPSETGSACNRGKIEPEKSAASHKYPVLRAIKSVRQSLEEPLKVPKDFPFKIKQCNKSCMRLQARNKMEIINVEVQRPNPTYNNYSLKIIIDVRRWFFFSKDVEFECIAYPGKITNITYVRDGFGNEYRPWDLDNNLQEAFEKYLENIGINLSTTTFIAEYMTSNSNKYLEFIKNLEAAFS